MEAYCALQRETSGGNVNRKLAKIPRVLQELVLDRKLQIETEKAQLQLASSSQHLVMKFRDAHSHVWNLVAKISRLNIIYRSDGLPCLLFFSMEGSKDIQIGVLPKSLVGKGIPGMSFLVFKYLRLHHITCVYPFCPKLKNHHTVSNVQ